MHRCRYSPGFHTIPACYAAKYLGITTSELRGSQHWVSSARAAYRETASALTADVVGVFRFYFPDRLLADARLVFVPEIPNPPFYAALAGQGLPPPLDFSRMTGLTLGDSILISKRFLPASAHELVSVLFHEMVHVTQYSVLSVDDFISEYVRGWAANGRLYEAIPLEVQAYALQERFVSRYPEVFDVQALVLASRGTT